MKCPCCNFEMHDLSNKPNLSVWKLVTKDEAIKYMNQVLNNRKNGASVLIHESDSEIWQDYTFITGKSIYYDSWYTEPVKITDSELIADFEPSPTLPPDLKTLLQPTLEIWIRKEPPMSFKDLPLSKWWWF